MKLNEMLKIAGEFLFLAIITAALIYFGALWASTESESIKHIRL